jgi:hypothetical protein
MLQSLQSFLINISIEFSKNRMSTYQLVRFLSNLIHTQSAAKCRCYFAYNILCNNTTFCTRLNMKVDPRQSGPNVFVITNLYRLCRVKRAYFYSLKPGCAIGCCPRQPSAMLVGSAGCSPPRAQICEGKFAASLLVQ